MHRSLNFLFLVFIEERSRINLIIINNFAFFFFPFFLWSIIIHIYLCIGCSIYQKKKILIVKTINGTSTILVGSYKEFDHFIYLGLLSFHEYLALLEKMRPSFRKINRKLVNQFSHIINEINGYHHIINEINSQQLFSNYLSIYILQQAGEISTFDQLTNSMKLNSLYMPL